MKQWLHPFCTTNWLFFQMNFMKSATCRCRKGGTVLQQLGWEVLYKYFQIVLNRVSQYSLSRVNPSQLHHHWFLGNGWVSLRAEFGPYNWVIKYLFAGSIFINKEWALHLQVTFAKLLPENWHGSFQSRDLRSSFAASQAAIVSLRLWKWTPVSLQTGYSLWVLIGTSHVWMLQTLK